jgi:hypothetical protein
MGMRRPRTLRTFPGTDALLLQKIFLVIVLGMVVVILALSMATAAAMGAYAQGGQLPWPIVQWVVTTPLGTLAIALVGGLAAGLPLLLVRRVAPVAMRPVDVTELPLSAWPHPLPPWRRPGGPTPAQFWLGRGWRQRVLSLLALALAGLLVLGSFAAFGAVSWYGLSHLPDCSGPRCPPTYSQLQGPPMLIGLCNAFLSQYAWVRQVERRCGVWFRVPFTLGDFTCYVRRPGVTAEAAAAALARYTRESTRPMARGAFVAALFFLPFFLVLIALSLLTIWLPTQWTGSRDEREIRVR